MRILGIDPGLQKTGWGIIDAGGHFISTAMADLAAVRDALEAKFGEAKKADLIWQPNMMTEVDEAQATALLALIEMLEDNDDVQTVTTNMEASDEIMEKLLTAE